MVEVRFAVAHLFDLPVECVRPEVPGDARGPRAVRVEARGRKLVIAADEAARARGVAPGQTETEAKARCPELDVRDRDEARESARLVAAAESLMTFGPEVEIGPPAFVALEIERSRAALRGRFDGEVPSDERLGEAIAACLAELGHRSAVAIADDVDTARTLAAELGRAASRSPPRPARVQVVPPGGAAGALAPLPLTALAWTDPREDPDRRLEAKAAEACVTLAALGIERVRDLYALEGHPLPSRLEDAGPLLLRRARAERSRPLRGHQPTERIVETFELDRGTEDIEPLLFILRRLVTGVCARLEGRGEATASVSLRWGYEPGLEHTIDDRVVRPPSSRRTAEASFDLARPTRDARVLFEVLREQLSVPGFVRGVALEATTVAPDPGAQLDLFSRHPQKLEAMSGLVSRLRARLGAEAVFSPRLVERHRPEAAWTAAPFDLDRALRDPSPPRPRRSSTHAPLLPWERDASRESALPQVDERLSVTGMAERVEDDDAPKASARPWPEPVPRRPDDEPPPPLPPRPTQLVPRPEPVRRIDDVIQVGGETLSIADWSGFERFETEWWTDDPLQRDYRVARTDDGRTLWLFTGPDGRMHLHGWFD